MESRISEKTSVFHYLGLLIIFHKCLDLPLKIFFLTELKQLMEVRANYARIRRQQGPEATDIVVSPPEKLQSLVHQLSF